MDIEAGAIPQQPTLAQLLRRLRLERNFSAKTMAGLIGYSSAESIIMIEHGRRTLPLEKMPAMAKALGIEPRDLLVRALIEYYPQVAEILYPEAAALCNGPAPARVPARDPVARIAHLGAEIRAITRRTAENRPRTHRHAGYYAAYGQTAAPASTGRTRRARPCPAAGGTSQEGQEDHSGNFVR